MHRIASQPGNNKDEQFELIEQPTAPILFLTSASTDISSLSQTLKKNSDIFNRNIIRALLINDIYHPAQIDHYLSTTAKTSQIIIVRLLGGKSHWSYGLEQIQSWQKTSANRNIIIISGVKENENELHEISSISKEIVKHLSVLFRYGGIDNFKSALNILLNILNEKEIIISNFKLKNSTDIIKWKWVNNNSYKVGVIMYNSLYKSNDFDLANEIYNLLIRNNLNPRIIFVSNLRDKKIQEDILLTYKKENLKSIVTTTSFSSIDLKEESSEKQLWDVFNIPIFQLLISTSSKSNWQKSQLGLNPTDLSLQVVMPEMDGRITTRPSGFKEIDNSINDLYSPIMSLKPYREMIIWVIEYIKNWIELQFLEANKKKITIILANYPIKNSRIANGVGLDTPESLLNILNWLKDNGYNLGNGLLPEDSNGLMNVILKNRTNDPESYHNSPLDYISLAKYENWWVKQSSKSKELIKEKWDIPSKAIDLEKDGFAIHGIIFGNISILIQPSRGYEDNSLKSLHSPDLPPPHRYLAQYLWIKNEFKSNAIIHLGKHGSVEWLPGKGIGLSESCFPHITLPALPNIYPFIVNDPGEGSQAKRRTQAVIIDHLTPPLGRSELYGDLIKIESLIDEYYESKILKSDRSSILENKLINLIDKQEFTFLKLKSNGKQDIDTLIDNIDSYICEIKDNQIRTGLHIFGKIPSQDKLIELIIAIARPPQISHRGLIQEIAYILNFKLDPWSEDETGEPSNYDTKLFIKLTGKKPRKVCNIIDYLELQAYILIKHLLSKETNVRFELDPMLEFNKSLIYLLSTDTNNVINNIKDKIVYNIQRSTILERDNLLKSLRGERVSSGPSGAPTRGRLEVLPTGKNFYSVDIRSLPTEASWDLGKKSSQIIIDNFKLENGIDLTHLALSIWATSTMRNGGEDISQILSFMGVKPVWDYSTRCVIDLEVIPLSILDRPRIDVLVRISGLFRDSFPQLVELLHLAQQKLSYMNEPINLNPYLKSRLENKDNSRIYGSCPGAYGAGLQELISNSNWENKKDLVDSYLNYSKWSYKGSENPIDKIDHLKDILNNIQVVLHNQDNKEHDILDSDDYYQFHGGLTAAVEKLSGKMPSVIIADHSRSSRPRINKLEKELDKVVRSRLLNPRWIEGIKKHGYKGAFEIGASIDYLFGYDATTNMVPNWCYKDILKTYLDIKENRDFLIKNNPWVMRDISERLLEAASRKMWSNPSENDIDKLKYFVNYSESIIENSV
tara:strand:+ start:9937 stop:13680 length:3744 start_codon:yes stop_codon:yes gene_type:complete